MHLRIFWAHGTVLHCEGVGNCAHIMFISYICICVCLYMYLYFPMLHVRSVHIVQIVLKKILNVESCYNKGLILEIIGASLDRCVHDIEIVLMTGGSLCAHNCAPCRLCSHSCRFFL